MTSKKKLLIEGTLSYLKQNFSPNTTLLVSKSHIKTVKLNKKDCKEVALYTPKIPFSIPLEKKTKEKPVLLEPVQVKIPESTKPLKERPHLPFLDLSKTLHRLFPYVSLKETPPDDQTALAMSNPSYIKALESNVVLFSFAESSECELFLENIKQAILCYHSSASLFSIVSCKTEEEVSLFLQHMQAKIVIGPQSLMQHKLFLPYIKELPASSERFVHKSRLLLLDPFTQYFTHPQKKKVLWQTLCNLLNTPASS